MSRILAMLGGCMTILAGLYGSIWVFLWGAIAAQRPDPRVADGDPCCGYPDNWQQVWDGVTWTMLIGLADALILAAGAALVTYGARGRRPRLRRLLWIPAGYLVLAAGLMAVSLTAAST